MPDDLISSFVSPKGVEQLQNVTERLTGILENIQQINREQIKIEGATVSSADLKALIDSLDRLAKSKGSFSAASKKLTEETAKARVELQEHNRAMLDGAKAQDNATQSRLRATQAAKEAAKEAARVAKEVKHLSNEYNALDAEHKKLEMEAKRVGVALGTESREFIEAAKNANALGAKLVDIDSKLGNHRRNVGNYSSAFNGLGMSIQQVAREMPNFAQSAQLGILAISNNLPILAEEIERAKVKITELKAAGKDAPSLFSQIAKSVFSWQTALTVAITLLVAFGQQLTDWVRTLFSANSALDKVNETFRKFLKESTEATAKEISKLFELDAVLQAHNSSRNEQIDAIEELIKLYPEQFANIDIENFKTRELNALLKDQVALLLRKQNIEAAEKGFTEAVSAETKARQELNDAISGHLPWYKKLLGSAVNVTQASANLTDAQNQAIIAEGLLNDTKNNSILQNEQLLVSLDKMIKQQENSKFTTKSQQERLRQSINLLRAYRQEVLDTIEASRNMVTPVAPGFRLSQSEIAQKLIEANLLAAKNGSKEELALLISNEAAKAIVATNALKARYVKEHKIREEDLANNASYQAELRLLEATTLNTIDKAKESFNKKSEGRKKQPYDPTSAELKGAKALIDAEAKKLDFELQQLIEAQRRIFENENESLETRLTNYDRFQENLKAQAYVAKEGEIGELKATLAVIEEQEKKTVDKRSKFAKDLIAQKDAVNMLIQTAQAKHVAELAEIDRKGDDGRLKIHESHSARILREAKTGYDELKSRLNSEENASLALLDQKYEEKKIGYREYQKERRRIQSEAANKLYAAEKDYLIKVITDIRDMPGVAKEVVDELNKILGTLNKPSVAGQENTGIMAISQKDMDLIKAAYDSLNSIMDGAAKLQAIRSKKRIDDLNAEVEAIGERKDAELAALDLTSLSHKEKADKKAEIEAVAASRERAIRAKIKEEEREAAINAKKIAIAQIILKTGMAIMLQLSQGLYATAPARAIAAGLAGAAELAVAIATPAYAKGTGKDGVKTDQVALVGEKGAEMRIDPDGTMSLTPDKATLTYLKKKTQIVPHDKTMEILRYATMHQLPLIPKERFSNDDVVDALDKQTGKIVKAITNSKMTLPKSTNKPNSYYN